MLTTISVKDLYNSTIKIQGVFAQVTDPNDFRGSGRYNGNAGIDPKYRELVGFKELPNGYGYPTIFLEYKTIDEEYLGLISFGSESYPKHIQIEI